MLERVSMSCNGCRILRKGCNDNCILRQSLQSIENPQSQANATVFVAKFFGRAGLISFLSSVPQSQRPALFQSLLFEACGRTVNPVSGAVGLLSAGNWHLCQSAVETVLAGGLPRCLPEFYSTPESSPEIDGGALEDNNNGLYDCSRDLNMRVKNGLTAARMTSRGREKRRADSPPSDESETTTLESGFICHQDLQQRKHHGNHETKLLRLFI